MKKFAFLLFLSAAAMGAENMQIPMNRALEFNRWYIKQVNNDHYPIMRGGKSISLLRPEQ
ncbi:hypothetical protein [Citrobacter farmeri]